MLLSFFQNFWFSGLGGWGLKGQKDEKNDKMAQNDKKILSNFVSRNLPHMIVAFGTHV